MSHHDHRLFSIPGLAPPGGDDYRLAFFAPQAPPNLRAAWNEAAGVFLFLGRSEEAIDEGVFSRALRRLLDEPLYRRARFLWIENPGAPRFHWRLCHLALEETSGGPRLAHRALFPMRNHALAIARHARARLDEDAAAFIIDADGHARPLQFLSAYETQRLDTLGPALALRMSGPLAGCLSFELRAPKTTDGDTLAYPAMEQLDAGIRLFFSDPHFPDSSEDPYLLSHRYPLFQEKLRHPLAGPYCPDALRFQVSVDPLAPLDPRRTHFTLAPFPSPWESVGAPSGFRANQGYTAHLLPWRDDSRLVFAERPARLSQRGHAATPLYLTPAGDYQVVVPRYRADGALDIEHEDNLVAGLSGVEYVKLARGALSLLRFRPDAPAHAPAFRSLAAVLAELPALLRAAAGKDAGFPIDANTRLDAELGLGPDGRAALLERLRLDYFPPGHAFDAGARAAFAALETAAQAREFLGKALRASAPEEGTLGPYPNTAWAYIRQIGARDGAPPSPAVYFAQPEQATLYRVDPKTPAFSRFLETPAAGLPAPEESVDEARAFPLLPYGAADGEALSDLRVLETGLINPLRRARVAEISAQDGHATPLVPGEAPAPALRGVTPQGLLAAFSPDFRRIESLLLAKDTGGQELLLRDIRHGDPLKTALQSSQLFLVASRPQALESYLPPDQRLLIQDWSFDLGPGHWTRAGTIWVFKFQQTPLLELLDDRRAWASPEVFNDDATAVAARLRQTLEKAQRLSQSDDPRARRQWRALARAATLADWTGILVFNAPVAQLPPDLAGLAAGIDAEAFLAAFLAAETTPVTTLDGNFHVGTSSLFGLIDYHNESPPPEHSSGYNFQVSALSAVFENSQLRDFSAELLLTLDRLFDERCELRDSPDGRNTLLLAGSAENHDGRVVYSFAFSGDNRYELPDSMVLREARILKAVFVTDGPGPDGKTGASFSFWGRLDFRDLERLDALSFGRQTPADEEGFLSFSNLRLALRFGDPVFAPDPDSGELIDTRSFRFDPRAMAFDLDKSRARPRSLYARFPLRLRALWYSDGDRPIDALDYMPVRGPSPQDKPDKHWYALGFDLELGGLGALAGKANLVASFMVAWRPGGEARGIYLGLKLPGSTGGKKEILIQGVLRVAFQSIQLVVYDISPDEPAYLLKLKNITLKFFVLSFPPSARAEIILFGDPKGGQGRRTLGWYAAYAKD
jgi:hypothetical protein